MNSPTLPQVGHLWAQFQIKKEPEYGQLQWWVDVMEEQSCSLADWAQKLKLWQNAALFGQVLRLGLGSWCFLVIHLLLGTALLRKLKAICREKSAFLMLSPGKLIQFDGCVGSVGGRHTPPSLPPR